MKKWFCNTVLSICGLLMLGGCQPDMESRSMVSKFRILTIQSNPPQASVGTNVELTGIFAPVAGQAAQVAWVTVDANWVALFDSFLPSNPEQYSTDELLAYLAVGFSAATDPELFSPKFKVVVTPVNPDTGLAVLPSEHLKISSTLMALLTLIGQTSGIPVYLLACSNGIIDTNQLLETVGNLSGSQEIGQMESACVGSNVETIPAYKTVFLDVQDAQSSVDSFGLNQNPQIGTFEIEEIAHLGQTVPLETGVVLCEGNDGCRDPVEFRVSLSKASYEYYTDRDGVRNEMEKTFVGWFATGGEFSHSRIRSDDSQFAIETMSSGDTATMDALIADTEEHHWFVADWLPPVEGGTFDLWIVANDLRGGVGYERYIIRADAPNY